MKNSYRTKTNRGRAARLAFALLMALCLTLTMMPTMAFATDGQEGGEYAGKTVILYTANLRGDVDVYAKLATAKKDVAAKGADAVYLVDAGNYLQGTTFANTTRGEAIYDLMDAAGYDAAAMGLYEFSYGDATTGYAYHGNFTKYHTQKQLLKGAEEEIYNKNNKTGDELVQGTLPAKAPATFKVLSSNFKATGETSGFYSFEENAVLDKGNLKVGLVAYTEPNVGLSLQDGFLKGYENVEVQKPEGAEVVIGLDNTEDGVMPGFDVNYEGIGAPTDGEETIGMLSIDNTTTEITSTAFNLDEYAEDAAVADLVADVKDKAGEVLFTNTTTLDGADRDNWCKETNLGDLTADALLWYAQSGKVDKFKNDVPVVAIQNGGNCDNFMYSGDVTGTDLLRSLPFSPMGVGVLYVTGEELLAALEAGTSPSAAYGDHICPGFAQVAGLTYNVDVTIEYAKGEAYGKFYKPDSYERASITSVGDKAFDPDATYAVIGDNYLMNGNDTYYMFKEAKEREGAYINNGNGVKTRDIVAMYVKEQCNGTVPNKYKREANRITKYVQTERKVITESTCEKYGVDECTFKDPGEGVVGITLTKATGHSWDAGKVTKTPTRFAEGEKTYTCEKCKATKTEPIAKISGEKNTMKASGKKATVKKGKKTTMKAGKVFKVTAAKGTVTYEKVKGNSKITVNKSGKVTVKKGLKKGKYSIKVKVTAAGDDIYLPMTTQVKSTIVVK